MLKRHPYAAIAGVLLLVLGSIDWTSHSIGGTPRAESYYGLFRGHIVWGYYGGEDQSLIPIFRPWEDELHFPTLGRKLEWGRGSSPPSLISRRQSPFICLCSLSSGGSLFVN